MARGRRRNASLSAVGKLGVFLACAAYCGLAVGTGLDAAAVDRADLVDYVPRVLASASLVRLGNQALKTGDGQKALAIARTALSREPIFSSSAAIFGSANYLLNRSDEARKGFEVRARLGSREPTTQHYWMQEALNAGDYQIAALRLDALLRQNPTFPLNPSVMPAFEANPQATAALNARLQMRPVWLTHFVAGSTSLDGVALDRRINTLSLLAQGGHPLGCGLAGQVVDRLARLGRLVQANAFDAAQCPRPMTGFIVDGNLTQLSTSGSYGGFLRWRIFPTGDMAFDLRPDPAGRGQIAKIRNEGQFPLPLLEQFVVVPAGRYRVNWLAIAAGGRPSTAITLKYGCNADNSEPSSQPVSLGNGMWQADIAVTNQCAGTLINFTVDPGGEKLDFGKVNMVALGS